MHSGGADIPNILTTILLVVVVCVAILQFFGSESRSKDNSESLLSRLTAFEWFRVALATFAVALILLNVYMGHQSDKEFSKTKELLRETVQKAEITNEQLKAKNEAIDGQLREAQRHRFGIIGVVEDVVDLRLQNSVLKSVLDEVEFIPINQFIIKLPELDHERQRDLSTIVDKQVYVNKGDRIDWKIDCESPLSETMRLNAATGSCSLDGFGAFQAYADRLIMSKLDGREILEGTLSSDGQLLFRTTCRKIHIALKQNQCKANVTILTRPIVRIYEERKKRKLEIEALDLSPVALKACRIYELLSDELHSEGSCKQEIRGRLLHRLF